MKRASNEQNWLVKVGEWCQFPLSGRTSHWTRWTSGHHVPPWRSVSAVGRTPLFVGSPPEQSWQAQEQTHTCAFFFVCSPDQALPFPKEIVEAAFPKWAATFRGAKTRVSWILRGVIYLASTLAEIFRDCHRVPCLWKESILDGNIGTCFVLHFPVVQPDG